MSATGFVCCLLTLLCVTHRAHCHAKQYHMLLKELTPLEEDFELDTNISSTIETFNKVVKMLADEISSLKTYLDNEKESRRALQSALDIATKQTEVLKNVLINRNTYVCTKEIEVLKEILLKKIKPQVSNEDKLERREAAPTSTPSEMIPTSTKPTTDLANVTEYVRVKYVPVKERIFKLVNTISSKMSSDKTTTTLSDIVVLQQEDKDVIVVADHYNGCVKSFWFDPLEDREFSSKVTLKSSRCYGRMVKLTERQIAIVCICSTKINIINVSPGLSINTTINTQRQNCALTSVTSQTRSGEERRLVTGHSSGMSIINMSGVVVKHMDTDIAGRQYVKIPHYLTSTPTGNIIVSDGDTGVLCVTQKREVLWKYTFKNLFGVDCDAQGNVFIADFGGNKVIVLSADGKFIKEALSTTDHVKYPTGIHYDSLKGRLYIAEYDSGLIKVFEHQ